MRGASKRPLCLRLLGSATLVIDRYDIKKKRPQLCQTLVTLVLSVKSVT